jgi:hypothetical protein
MKGSYRVRITAFAALLAALVLAAGALATATPVGPLPKGPTTTVSAARGTLVSVALPHSSGGKVWRQANTVNQMVLNQVGEADVGASVVIVFKAVGKGTTKIAYGLTKGETKKAYASQTFTVTVR